MLEQWLNNTAVYVRLNTRVAYGSSSAPGTIFEDRLVVPEASAAALSRMAVASLRCGLRCSRPEACVKTDAIHSGSHVSARVVVDRRNRWHPKTQRPLQTAHVRQSPILGSLSVVGGIWCIRETLVLQKKKPLGRCTRQS